MNEPTTDTETIRNYLLGLATEAESDAIEVDYLAREQSLDAVSAVEQDLIDDSLSGRLGPGMQARFESHYLATAPHRQRTAFARALRSRTVRGRRSPAFGYFAWAAILILAVVVSVAYFAPWMRGVRIAVITLPAVAVRGEGDTPTLVVDDGAREIELRLERGEANADPPLQVLLRTVEGEEVWRGPASSAPGKGDAQLRLVATARVPASRLAAGDYVVVLARGPEGAEVQRYFFRVVRP